MPASLPYLPSYKNVEKLFTGIANARIPDSFGQKYLTETLGLKSNGDRPLIPFLRNLNFLDESNRPTSNYALLKNPSLKGCTIANAIRHAYAPLFDANEKTNELSPDALKGLVSQVSGADSNTIAKITGTLNALLKLADFTSIPSKNDNMVEIEDIDTETSDLQNHQGIKKIKHPSTKDNNPVPFHFNIQVHLPSSASEEVYLNIFNAIRKVFN